MCSLTLLILCGSNALATIRYVSQTGAESYTRSANPAGPFAVINSIGTCTYVDPNVTATMEKGLYYVTFRDDSISRHMQEGFRTAR